MLEMKPDTPSEKSRKRRSSRTGGLTPKDPWGGILLFRTVQDDKYNIYDWHITVKPYLTPNEPENSPLSPLSPPLAIFSNPFGSRDSRSVASSTGRPEVQQRTPSQNTYPHAPQPRERPSALISPSPSLRSRRSDLSSQASSMNPPMGFTAAHPQSYSSALPTDLPSPASTSGYDNQFIEGWTSAQGRSSALSSHTRGSNSIASAVAPVQPVASSPPGPRETILDRAFQLRCIPGSDRIPDKDEEKISSIARFEALMREVDERKQNKLLNQSSKEKQDWDLDEESEESDFGEPQEDDDDDDDPDGLDTLDMSDQDVSIPTPAQRALDYISGRRTPLPQSRPLSPARSPPIPFLNQQAMSAFHGHSNNGGLRPRTGTTPSHQRNSRPNSLALPSRSISTTTIPSLKDSGSSGSSNKNLKTGTDPKEKRRSSTSVKRLSFTEFAKRLSSTSSLLLVQTNASSSSGRDGSRRGSSEYGVEEATTGMRGGAGPSPISDRSKRCGWRGSVGAFGGEGGFL
jgi:hypothetical protein